MLGQGDGRSALDAMHARTSSTLLCTVYEPLLCCQAVSKLSGQTLKIQKLRLGAPPQRARNNATGSKEGKILQFIYLVAHQAVFRKWDSSVLVDVFLNCLYHMALDRPPRKPCYSSLRYTALGGGGGIG